MGDRVSISFALTEKYPNGKTNRSESVVLFNHWGGMGFVAEAKRYAKNLEKEMKGKGCYPLERLEPNTVMVDFIRHYFGGSTVMSNLYLGKDELDGDNSDNGHHTIELNK